MLILGLGNPKKSNIHFYCSVDGCDTYYPEKNVSFHWFPKANKRKVPWVDNNGLEQLIDKRLAWSRQLEMGKETHDKNLRICSKHFLDEDFFSNPLGIIIIDLHFSDIITYFIFLGIKTLRRMLKRDAIPTKNIFLKKSFKTQYFPRNVEGI